MACVCGKNGSQVRAHFTSAHICSIVQPPGAAPPALVSSPSLHHPTHPLLCSLSERASFPRHTMLRAFALTQRASLRAAAPRVAPSSARPPVPRPALASRPRCPAPPAAGAGAGGSAADASSPASSSSAAWAVTYLYDGDCPACRTLKNVLSRQDGDAGRVRFVNIADPSYNEDDNFGVLYEDAMDTIHVYTPSGDITTGEAVVCGESGDAFFGGRQLKGDHTKNKRRSSPSPLSQAPKPCACSTPPWASAGPPPWQSCPSCQRSWTGCTN